MNRTLSLSGLVFFAFLTGCTVSAGNLIGSGPKNQEPVKALAFQSDSDFGKSLTQVERKMLSRAELRALNYGMAGEEIGWKNKSGESTGSIVASQFFRVGESNCRRFEHRISTLTGPQKVDGTACRSENGSWHLIQ